jgi:hypothetical protein
VLPFEKKEQECWKKISNKIHQDSLLNIPKLLELVQDCKKEREHTLINNYAELLNYVLSTTVTRFEEVLFSKYRQGIMSLLQVEDHYREEVLKNDLQLRLKVRHPENLIDAAKSLTQEILTKIFVAFKKHFVFVSDREIHAPFAQSN